MNIECQWIWTFLLTLGTHFLVIEKAPTFLSSWQNARHNCAMSADNSLSHSIFNCHSCSKKVFPRISTRAKNPSASKILLRSDKRVYFVALIFDKSCTTRNRKASNLGCQLNPNDLTMSCLLNYNVKSESLPFQCAVILWASLSTTCVVTTRLIWESHWRPLETYGSRL